MHKNIKEEGCMFGKNMDTDVHHKISMKKPRHSDEIISFIEGRLNAFFSGHRVTSKTDNELSAKGNIAGTLALLGMTLDVSARTEDNDAKIKVTGKTRRGPMFWITWVCLMIIVIFLISAIGFAGVVIGFIPIIAFVIMMKMVEKKPKQLIDKIVQETDVEFS